MHTVLVVDDDDAVRRTLTRFLGLDGFTTVEARNGQVALAYLRGGGVPDVILLDLHMPIVDGRAFRRAQLADPALARIPVIILSAEEVHRYPELAALTAFHKPTSLSALLCHVRRLCESPETPDESAVSTFFGQADSSPGRWP